MSENLTTEALTAAGANWLLGHMRLLTGTSNDSEIARTFRELDKRLQYGELPTGWLNRTDELVRLTRWLHSKCIHPEYEYKTTRGQRKAWPDADTPPEGEGWLRNYGLGINGWERFDYHEESYWLRPSDPELRGSETEQ